MAAFTSAQTGNWNDGATWGNTSPGVKGTDWPGLAGDTATVANTHTVTYNVSETNQLGTVTINSGGILTFSASMSTLLTLGNVDLTISAGGTLNVGTSGTPIPAAYTAQINIASTASTNAFTQVAGSTVTLYGDPTFYGSTISANIAANYTTGQTFTVSGDLTSTWAAGNTLMLIKDGEYGAMTTDWGLVTIASVAANGGNTDITINESFPGGTFSIGSVVYNVGRNVIVSLNGSLAYSLTSDSSSGAFQFLGLGGESTISSAAVVNLYQLNSQWATLTNAVFFNYYQPGTAISAYSNIASTNTIFYTGSVSTKAFTKWHGTAIMFGNATTNFTNCYFSDLKLIGNTTLSTFINSYAKLLVYKNGTATGTPIQLSGTTNSKIYLTVGENENGLSYWTDNNIYYLVSTSNPPSYIEKLNTPAGTWADLFYNENSSTDYWNRDLFINDLNDGGPAYFSNYGYGTYETAGSGSVPTQRTGGSDKIWQFVTASNIRETSYITVPIRFAYYTSASTKTFSIYFQTDYASNAAYECILSHPDTVLRTTGSIATRASASDWSQYAQFASVTFTTAAWCYIEVRVWGYEASKYIWSDPLITVT